MNKETTADWKSFKSLVALQTQNALNDKMAQFLILPLAYWLTSRGLGDYGYMPHLLAILIVLPYLLFAPFTGWLNDRFPKSLIIRWSMIFQTGVFGGLLLSILTQQIWGAVGCFFILAIQSTILAPAKRGIIKELVGERHLGRASGLLEMSVIMAVCLGQILAGFWFAYGISQGATGWEAARTPLILLFLATSLPIFFSFFIQNTGSQTQEKWEARMAFSHFSQLSRIWRERDLRLCAFGKSFFWGYAGVLNLWQILLAEKVSVGTGQEYAMVLSFIMIAASGGIILGGVTASMISKNRIELGLLPIGGGLMLLGVLLLACSPAGSVLMYFSFIMAGAGGALFLVPLNGQLQNLAPAAERGKILAGSSVLDCVFGLSAVAFQAFLSAVGLPIWGQCLILSVIILGVLFYVLRLLPKTFVSFLLRSIMGWLYKVKAQGIENMPAEGGVLLTPNHISYVDSIILSAASPRPVRFLMIRDCFNTPGVGLFARYFDTIAISRNRAKEAIRLAADALKEGTVVCIFPEGQLTTTGALAKIQRGFQMIAKKAQCPVLPVYMDGLWGTLTSYEGGKMYYKVPRRNPRGVRVHFGEALEGKADITPEKLGASLHALSHEAMCERREMNEESWIRKRLKSLTLPEALSETLSALSWEELQKYLFNALQLNELALFRERKRLGVEEGTGAELTIALLAAVSNGTFYLHREDAGLQADELNRCDYLFIGKTLKERVRLLHRPYLIEVNGGAVAESVMTPAVFPARLENGLFTTFSMPHGPSVHVEGTSVQPGWRHHSVGRILPGTKVVPQTCDEQFFMIEE